MTAADIINELQALGTESYRKTLIRHGARDPVYGVKVADLKVIQKRVGTDYRLSLELYDTGSYDAQYLAGLIADDAKMTRQDLKRWLAKANCLAISGTTVAWVAAGSRYGADLAMQWIDAPEENKAQAGWHTLSSLVSVTEDSQLDLKLLERLLKRIGQTIHDQANRVRYAMNNFVIATGIGVAPLTRLAIQTAESMGCVTVDMGDTACEVPDAAAYIRKAQQRGSVGKKRKSAKC